MSSDNSATIGPKRVDARALKLDGVFANVKVEPSQGSDVEFTITGPSDEVDAISHELEGTTLVIRGGAPTAIQQVQVGHKAKGISILSGIRSKSSISIGNISIVSSGTDIVVSDGTSSIDIVVKVPMGTAVEANNVQGDVTIGDTEGPLTVHLQSHHDVTAGRVTNTRLSLQGSGDITIDEVNGTLDISLQGSGDIEVDDGTISSLSASLQGSGDIKVGGSAQRATLNLMGSGDIRVAHVHQTPRKSTMGSGHIKIKRIG